MASQQHRAELDAKARQGETVVPGGTGGKSLEAQEYPAEAEKGKLGESNWGMKATTKWEAEEVRQRKEQLGHEGYQEMGRKGGLSTTDKSGEERAAE